LIFCKNLCKCYNIPTPSTTILTIEKLGKGYMEKLSVLFATHSLYSYLRQTKMSSLEHEEQEGRTVPAWGLAPVGGAIHKEMM
jgi:hypothetical protein